jgi:hypothetical protein
MKQILSIILCLSLVGCTWPTDSKGNPKPQEGSVREEQTVKQQDDVIADVMVESVPVDPLTTQVPPTNYKIFGRELTVPTGTKVSITAKNDYSMKQNDFYKMLGNFNYKSGQGQMIFIGAMCVAGGAVLCYFGLWSIGVGLIIFGILLITCGVVIERYPWVFLCVLVLGLIAVVAFVIYTIRHKNATTATTTTEAVLAEVCNSIEALKKTNPELVKQFITDELKKSDISATIKDVVTKVKG